MIIMFLYIILSTSFSSPVPLFSFDHLQPYDATSRCLPPTPTLPRHAWAPTARSALPTSSKLRR